MSTDRPLPGRPLTPAQGRALIALVDCCPALGHEVSAKAVADSAHMAGGATTLALRGLGRRQFAVSHGTDEDFWSPTLTGRAKARELDDRAARTGEAEKPAQEAPEPETT